MAETKPITLTLIRTGATSWELAGRLAGGVDVPLCKEAEAQCPDLAREVAAAAPGLVLHAGDQASRVTADAVAEAAGSKVRELADLADINLGLWAGLTESSLEERSPTIWRLWREDPTAVSIPEGEQVGAASERITGCLVRALSKSKDGASVAVVLRPIAFGLVRCWLDGMPPSLLWQALESGGRIDRRTIAKERLRRDGARAS